VSNCWQRSQHTKQQADPREANAETFASNIEINGTYRNNGIITGVSNPPDNGIISYLTLYIKAFIAVSVPKKVISVSNQGFHQLVIIQASIAMSIFLVTHCETIADPHSLTFKASFIASYNVTCFGGVGGFSWISFIKNHNILLCQISFTRYSPCDPNFFYILNNVLRFQWPIFDQITLVVFSFCYQQGKVSLSFHKIMISFFAHHSNYSRIQKQIIDHIRFFLQNR